VKCFKLLLPAFSMVTMTGISFAVVLGLDRPGEVGGGACTNNGRGSRINRDYDWRHDGTE
jgi:hypothetical protein